jgi:hypothetical protein
VQYVEKKFMEVDYNFKIMFIIICCSRKSPYKGGGAMVKNLTFQCEGEEFKSPHLQPRLLAI